MNDKAIKEIAGVNNAENTPGRGKGRPFKRGNPGRPKGARGEFTDLKDAFLQAFYDKDGMNGAEGIKELIRNSSRNKIAFLQMISKMLPSNLNVSGDMNINVTLSDKFLPEGNGAKENGSKPK